MAGLGIGDLLEPREFVREGRFGPAFEVRLARVDSGDDELFSDPADFFRMTVPTKGMVDACVRVLEGLTGRGEGTVVLQTRFGGGKTHVLATLWHLAEDPSAAREEFVPRVRERLGRDAAEELDRLLADLEGLEGRTVVIDELELSTALPEWAEEARSRKAPHLAWAARLDRSVYEEWVRKWPGPEGASEPDRGDVREALESVLGEVDFVLTLVDEAPALMVGRPRRIRDGFVKFFQVLHDATQEVPGAGLTISIPDESVYRYYRDELGSKVTPEDVRETSEDLASVLRRTAELADPVGSREEFLEIARRRLFERVDGPPEDLIVRFRERLEGLLNDGDEAREWAERLEESWPFHPALIDLLWGKLADLEGFQRARGALKALAALTRWALENDPDAPWIGPEHACLRDGKVSNHVVEPAGRLGEGPIDDVEERARNVEAGGDLDPVEVARVVFLHSLPREASGARWRDVLVAVARPDREFSRADVETLLERKFVERLWHYHVEDGRFLFKEERNATALIVDARREVEREDEERVLREFLYQDRKERRRVRERWSGLGVNVRPELEPLEKVPDLRVLVWPEPGEVREAAKEGPVLAVLKPGRDPGEFVPREYPNAVAFLVPDEDGFEDALDRAGDLEAVRIAFERDEAEGLEDDLRSRARDRETGLRKKIRSAYRTLVVLGGGGDLVEVRLDVKGTEPGALGEAVKEGLPTRETISPIYLARRIVTDETEAVEVYLEFLRRPGEGWPPRSEVRRALREAVRRGFLAARKGDRVCYLEDCPLDLDRSWKVGPPTKLEPPTGWIADRVEEPTTVGKLLEGLTEDVPDDARETVERTAVRVLSRAVEEGELVAVRGGERLESVDPEELLRHPDEIVVGPPEEEGPRPVSREEVLGVVRDRGETTLREIVEELGGEDEVDPESVREVVGKLEADGELEVEGDPGSGDAVVRVPEESAEVSREVRSEEELEGLLEEIREKLGGPVAGRVSAFPEGRAPALQPVEGVVKATVYAFTDDGSLDAEIVLEDDGVKRLRTALQAVNALKPDDVHLDLELEGVSLEDLERLLRSLVRSGELDVDLRPAG